MTESLQGAAASRRRVIVLDDEQTIANTLVVILNNAGFEATASFCGNEAVKLLESFPPDFLIADVIMPDISGMEVAIIVRDRFPKCKILLFSGQATTSDMLHVALSRGYEFEIVAKPVHPTFLLEKLRTL